MPTDHRPRRPGLPSGRVALAFAAAAALAATVLTTLFLPTSAAAANACNNPILAQNLNGWGPLDGAAVSRDPVGDLPGVNYAFDTSGHSFYMPQLSVTAGQKWKFSAVDRVVYGSGTARMTIEWYNGSTYLSETSGTAVALPQSSAAGGSTAYWTTVTVTATAPSGATSAHVLQEGTLTPSTGTDFKATQCSYELVTGTSSPSPTPTSTSTSTSAAVRHGWGSPNPSQSDEYNGTSVDLTKWGLFGADAGQSTGCSPGFNGHGQRCASQTTEGGGYLTVTGTANGVTGGLYSRSPSFRYGRIEVRERALPTADNGGRAYHAVPLLWPSDDDYTHGEIDFAERDVADPTVALFVHHDGTQTFDEVTIDSRQFHNYAIDWQPNSVSWYVDGNLVRTVNVSINKFSNSNGGAQMDMFPATGTLMRPARQDVDWVRMYPVAATTYQ